MSEQLRNAIDLLLHRAKEARKVRQNEDDEKAREYLRGQVDALEAAAMELGRTT
jgi:hypothetical protein